MPGDELPKHGDEDGELLRMAVAISLRKESGLILQKEKKTNWTIVEQYLGGEQEENLDQGDDEEKMLKMAVAMSLEKETGVNLERNN